MRAEQPRKETAAVDSKAAAATIGTNVRASLGVIDVRAHSRRLPRIGPGEVIAVRAKSGSAAPADRPENETRSLVPMRSNHRQKRRRSGSRAPGLDEGAGRAENESGRTCNRSQARPISLLACDGTTHDETDVFPSRKAPLRAYHTTKQRSVVSFLRFSFDISRVAA